MMHNINPLSGAAIQASKKVIENSPEQVSETPSLSRLACTNAGALPLPQAKSLTQRSGLQKGQDSFWEKHADLYLTEVVSAAFGAPLQDKHRAAIQQALKLHCKSMGEVDAFIKAIGGYRVQSVYFFDKGPSISLPYIFQQETIALLQLGLNNKESFKEYLAFVRAYGFDLFIFPEIVKAENILPLIKENNLLKDKKFLKELAKATECKTHYQSNKENFEKQLNSGSTSFCAKALVSWANAQLTGFSTLPSHKRFVNHAECKGDYSSIVDKLAELQELVSNFVLEYLEKRKLNTAKA